MMMIDEIIFVLVDLVFGTPRATLVNRIKKTIMLLLSIVGYILTVTINRGPLNQDQVFTFVSHVLFVSIMHV